MPRSFYNSTDDDLSTGAANLIAIVGLSPTTYGTTAGAITSYTTLSTNYTTLLGLVREPGTRTPTKVTEENAARKLLREASLNFSRIFRSTSTVTNAMLQALNMPERVVPQPIPAPATAPGLIVKSVDERVVTLRLLDLAEDRRGKPRGVAGASIFSHIGANPPENLSDYKFEGNSSKVEVVIEFAAATAPGTKVWFTAFWFNNRKESSPMATPISTNIQGGGVSLAA